MADNLYLSLACPTCKGPLTASSSRLVCRDLSCNSTPKEWPVTRGVPILIDESRSIFRIDSLTQQNETKSSLAASSFYSLIRDISPSLSRNFSGERNIARLVDLLGEQNRQSNVLVLGCGDGSPAVAQLGQQPFINVVNIDVRWTSIVDVICDGHDLPFVSATFDAVIIQGVLEHVLRAARVVDEVHRVLTQAGLVYCEYPFLQPNHGGPYDFTRLTFTGHRHLWRHFELIDAGACCGPGMALANSAQQFARALMPSRAMRTLSDMATNWTLWWLKYFDKYLITRGAGLDGASAFYFMGRRGTVPISDTEVLASYRGAQV